ncbi:MAG: hypothetical protein K6U78_18640, partial [Anaerolineae bacterium]|nr:hypothetical protein [Anaerolineae bacterium]
AYCAEFMRQAERLTMLRVVDSHWVRHLTDLDILREGIGLRAYGQQNPLVAFKKEAFEMYEALRASIQRDIVALIYHVSPAPAPPARRPLRALRPQLAPLPPSGRGQGATARESAPILQTNRSDGGGRPAPARSAPPAQIGRNDPSFAPGNAQARKPGRLVAEGQAEQQRVKQKRNQQRSRQPPEISNRASLPRPTVAGSLRGSLGLEV